MSSDADRILTTHVGSLPRPDDLVEYMRAKQAGEKIDQAALAIRVRSAVAEIVAKQVEIGLDIVADGEMSKVGFIPYINERLEGFAPSQRQSGGSYWGASRDALAFPDYYEWVAKQPGTAGDVGATRWSCCGPVAYKGQRDFQADVDNLRAALVGKNHVAAFMPAVSPGNVETWEFNEFYNSEEEYLHAIAEALRQEYLAVIDAGLLLQVDDPQLATYYILHPEKTIEECRRWAEIRVEALNHALRGIPREKIRYHTCYSINMGPRVHDMELKDIIDVMLKVKAGAFSFEASNPRHEHEWVVWADAKMPDDITLIPGVVTHSTTLVEHPELVAQRIERFASVVGRERVIAGADCGFASFATSHEMHASIVWAKLAALTEGARIASARLWGRA
jgi:5-methyltetrahydropteroyltriglutamate--homocysteine methyltransferase